MMENCGGDLYLTSTTIELVIQFGEKSNLFIIIVKSYTELQSDTEKWTFPPPPPNPNFHKTTVLKLVDGIKPVFLRMW